jgi:hypothetical protein
MEGGRFIFETEQLDLFGSLAVFSHGGSVVYVCMYLGKIFRAGVLGGGGEG